MERREQDKNSLTAVLGSFFSDRGAWDSLPNSIISIDLVIEVVNNSSRVQHWYDYLDWSYEALLNIHHL